MKIIRRLALPAIACIFLFCTCKPKILIIHSIHPQIGIMGDPVTIKGEGFGNEKAESYVTIAGAVPTGSSYIEWNDTEITFRPPAFGESGLIYVFVNGIKSNGVLFANQAYVPELADDIDNWQAPKIISITPQGGSPGTLVKITGTGFGTSRGNSEVYFSWNSQVPMPASEHSFLHEYASVSDLEFGYEMWSDKEIHVRVPDGAVSGNIEVRNTKGASPPLFFEITGKPGIKTLKEKNIYTISYMVNVKTREAQIPNNLFLWVPQPVISPSQRNLLFLSGNIPPFIEDYRGTRLYKFNDIPSNSELTVNLSMKIDVYSVETEINPQSIRQAASPIREIYTQSTDLLPSGDSRIRNRASTIIGRERNQYLNAQKIYEWLINEDFIWEQNAGDDIFAMMETKKADPYLAALLYCAMLRSSGIPAFPVAGVLIDRNRQAINHWWVEFWVDGFGWVPVDPAMGAGAIPAFTGLREDRAKYYFGNIDCNRIAFSRTVTLLSKMDPRGRVITHNRSYALQNLWEEVAGGIENYSSLWGGITITGIYSQ